MKHALTLVLFLLAVGTFPMGAHGQQVYRCGKSYSQIPCPGAVVVDTRDVRTKTQQRQSQKATKRDTELANDLAETRKQEEAMALAGSTPAVESEKPKSGKSKTGKNKSGNKTEVKKSSKKKEPEFFTAKNPPEKKKEKKQSPSTGQ